MSRQVNADDSPDILGLMAQRSVVLFAAVYASQGLSSIEYVQVLDEHFLHLFILKPRSGGAFGNHFLRVAHTGGHGRRTG